MKFCEEAFFDGIIRQSPNERALKLLAPRRANYLQ